jgi:ankyrin repeat protein
MGEGWREADEFAQRMFAMARNGDDVGLVEYIDEGVYVDLTDPAGNTLLILAAHNGHAAAVRALLDRGADPDRVNNEGETALSGAVQRGKLEVVRILIEAGADPALGTPSAVEAARSSGHPELQEVLHSGPPTLL